jgi:FMN phosphatase YigB (HAD superfamily)
MISDEVPNSSGQSGTYRHSEITAVLLDSGGVLMQPIGGRWHPRADFEANVLAHAAWVTPAVFAEGFAAGDRFFAASTETPDLDDYHRAVLDAMGVPVTPGLLAELRRPVPPSEVLEAFPEVIGTLEDLRGRGLRMAVVSDAWPNLPELHEGLGIGREFFESYTISAELGFRKPDPRMYRHASDALGLEPANCLFVDDDPGLVAAAISLGYAGRALCRDATDAVIAAGEVECADGTFVPCITSLDQLLDVI